MEVKVMLDHEKVKTMTKLAIYEDRTGKEDIKLSQYYKTDYVRLQVINTFVFTTIGYLFVLLLLGLYKAEYLIQEAVSLDYGTIGMYLLGIYLMVVIIYCLCTIIICSIKYEKSRKQLKGYYRELKYLHKLYEEEEK